MNGYRSAAKGARREIVIEKSRFLAFCAPISGEEEAKALLYEEKKRYSDATHICYGYVADRAGALPRFSDDGEPSGTAGMPILKAIQSSGLVLTLVSVTRYFGGIKLGAGGLVRAYTRAAAEAIAESGVADYISCVRLAVTLDYTAHSAFAKAFAAFPVKTERTDFGGEVTLTLLLPQLEQENFIARLHDFSLGKAKTELLERLFAPDLF